MKETWYICTGLETAGETTGLFYKQIEVTIPDTETLEEEHIMCIFDELELLEHRIKQLEDYLVP